MPTDIQILTLTQWLSPAFPIGSFAYSHGLEGAVAQQDITEGSGLESWLTDILVYGAGYNDALFLAAAYHAPDTTALCQIDLSARAFASSKERLLETCAQGRAFGLAVSDWHVLPQALTYPVALGAAAQHQDMPLILTQKMYLQAFMSNLIAAGQRLLPVGQQEGLAMLHRLTPLCETIATQTSHGRLDDLGAAAFGADIAAMQHETQYSRIFRT
ncbi:MAG: urease accessory protein UreF [Pelagimonas sp.]|jgi:urease accessory protein|nr:urease accessory protein UreF [Pelagimonas sp.]